MTDNTDSLVTDVMARLPEVHDDTQYDLLCALIQGAKDRITAYVNIDGNRAQPKTYDPEWDWITREVVITMYNRIGDEGKKISSEGSISQTWESIDIGATYGAYLDQFRSVVLARVRMRMI